MKKIKELNVKDLKNECEIEDFKFKKTTELEPFNGIIGQERAMNAIKTAMQIPQKGFNLYLCGSIGIGKTAYALSVVNNLAKDQPVPNDICYVYNFENPNEPISIVLEPGMGLELREI